MLHTRPVPPLHHDGHALNDAMSVLSTDPERGGSPDFYLVVGADGEVLGRINFQHGPRGVEGSVAGLTHEVLLAILIDRSEGFERGPFANDANAACLVHLRTALALLKERVAERASRGVLGSYAP